MQYGPMRHTLGLFAAAALIGTLGACDSMLSPDAGAAKPLAYEALGEAPKVIDGRLFFADTTALERYLAPLGEVSTEELAQHERQIAGFQSLRAYLDNGLWQEEAARATEGSEEPTGNEAAALEKDGVTRADFAVSDGFLSALNSRGEVQIGGVVYKVTRDNVYQTTPDQVAGLNGAVPTLSSPAPGDGRFKFVPVETTTSETQEAAAFSRAATTGTTATGGEDRQMTGGCNVYGAGGRHYGSSYISHYWFYAEAGVLTQWERRHRFLWWEWWSTAWQPGVLYHEWQGDVGFGYTTGAAAQASTHRIHNILRRRVGWFPRINGWLNARHDSPAGSCWT